MRNRIFRTLLCLLVVCCLLFTQVSAAMVATPAIVSVSISPVVVSVLKGLGVTALATTVGSAAFSNLVDSCITHLQSIGLCQETTINVFGYSLNGYSVFGVTAGLVDAVRSWLFEEEVVSVTEQNIYESAGFIYNSSSNASANLYWQSVDIFSLFNAGSSSDSLLTCLSAGKYSCITLSGNTLHLYSLNSLTPYTSLDYPMGTLQKLSCYKRLDSSVTLANTASGSLYINYGVARTNWQTTGEATFFLTGDSRLRFDDVKYENARHWFDNVGYISSSGAVYTGQSVCLFEDYYADYKPSGLYPSVTGQETGISVSDGLEAEYIAPQESTLAEGYADWYKNSTILTDSSTAQQVVTLPIPQAYSYQEALTQTQTDVWEGTKTETGTDTGTSTDTWTPPAEVGGFALDLTNYFPFCIPFDMYDFLCCLGADPVAPVIEWEIALPGGDAFPLSVDLSAFDSVAQLLRRLELLLFIIGLGLKTRDLIKG